MIETDPKTCVNDLGLLAVPFRVCECVCVLQCHQMTTLFGLDESPKALRNRRNVEMEITVPGLPQFPPVYLLSSSLPPSSILFHNQKREKQTLRTQIICALSGYCVLGQ